MVHKYALYLSLNALVITAGSLVHAMELPPHGMKREELPAVTPPSKKAIRSIILTGANTSGKSTMKALPSCNKREELPPCEQDNTHVSPQETLDNYNPATEFEPY